MAVITFSAIFHRLGGKVPVKILEIPGPSTPINRQLVFRRSCTDLLVDCHRHGRDSQKEHPLFWGLQLVVCEEQTVLREKYTDVPSFWVTSCRAAICTTPGHFRFSKDSFQHSCISYGFWNWCKCQQKIACPTNAILHFSRYKSSLFDRSGWTYKRMPYQRTMLVHWRWCFILVLCLMSINDDKIYVL